MTAAHEQTTTHTYTILVPAHPPREADPHYRDFEAYHRKTRPAARCYIGERLGFDDCHDEHGRLCVIDAHGVMSGLELHHTHIEFCLTNGIDLAALEHDYPGVSNPDEVGAWVESAQNLRWLCSYHHRGLAGAHTLDHSNWEGSQYVLRLVKEPNR